MKRLKMAGVSILLVPLLCLLLFPTCEEGIDTNPPDDGKEYIQPVHPRCDSTALSTDLTKTPLAFPTCYRPDELISNTTGYSQVARQELFDYLQKTHKFKKVATCDCEQELILWRHPPPFPDLIGVVESAPPDEQPGAVGNGLSLNYDIELPNNEEKTYADSDARQQILNSLAQVQSGAPVVRVGVSDSGTWPSPFLANNQTYPGGSACDRSTVDHPLGLDMYNVANPEVMDFLGHGSMVNGIIAGASIPLFPRSGKDVAIELLNAKITEATSPHIDLYQAICGLYYLAKQDVNVINISWGFDSPRVPVVFIPFLKYAADKNIVIAAGAGNGKTLLQPDHLFWPAGFSRWPKTASYSTVIAVGAYQSVPGGDPILADFSNHGKMQVDVVAPGVDIIGIGTIQHEPKLQLVEGTSYAAPYVARTAAIIRGLHPNLSAREIKDCIIQSATNVATNVPGYSPMPVFDHAAALQECSTRAGGNPTPN